jgi:hypothetical protein
LQHDFLRRKKIFHIVKYGCLVNDCRVITKMQAKKNRCLSTGFFRPTDSAGYPGLFRLPYVRVPNGPRVRACLMITELLLSLTA